jgi:hypothetical protein
MLTEPLDGRFQAGERRFGDLHQEARLTRDVVALEHARQLPGQPMDRLELGSWAAHAEEGGDRQPGAIAADEGAVPRDHPRFFQSPDPFRHGGLRQPDFPAERPKGQSGVRLQRGDNFTVLRVQGIRHGRHIPLREIK